MSTTVHINEQDTILLTFTDKAGKPSQAPSSVVPTWSLSNPALATINPAADGRSALVVPVAGAVTDPNTPVDVTVTAAANMPDGTALVPGSVVLTLVANVAVNIVLTALPAVVQA